jgi:hypothetical protein
MKKLPEFFIIGSQKSGTTALYNIFKNHPEIVPGSGRKEINYYEKRYYLKKQSWYRKQFIKLDDKRLAFEASTNYIFHPWTPKRIKHDCSNAKIIAILRDPVERAISHYHHMVRDGKEQRKFGDAIDYEVKYLFKKYENCKKNRFYFSKELRLTLSRCNF